MASYLRKCLTSLVIQFSSLSCVQLLRPHAQQHTRFPCPSPTPGACSSSCPLMPSIHLILYRPLLLPSIFARIRVFSNESVLCIRCPKYWSFSFSISPSNEYSGLRMDWLDLHAIQGTLKSLFQHHSWKASILQPQLYSTTLTSIRDYWKNHSFD